MLTVELVVVDVVTSAISSGNLMDIPASASMLVLAASLSRLRAAAADSSMKPVPGSSARPVTR
jgi:hypothetical protein